jgi:hypothetical protein
MDDAWTLVDRKYGRRFNKARNAAPIRGLHPIYSACRDRSKSHLEFIRYATGEKSVEFV